MFADHENIRDRKSRRRFSLADFRRDDGVAAVEFALVAPVFFAILFGIIVYGIYFTTSIAVTEAASEGARASVAGLSTAERQQLAGQSVQAFFNAYAPFLSFQNVTPTYTQVTAGSFQVQVIYDLSGYGLNILSGLLPIPNSKLTATVTVSNGG